MFSPCGGLCRRPVFQPNRFLFFMFLTPLLTALGEDL
jgi:hypothetical protein